MPVRVVLFALLGLVSLGIGLWELTGRAPLNPALPPATSAAEEIALTTTGVYVSLRVINAALSAAQEVEVGASLGAQASLQPLKVLEPIDDTVERVADVVFAVAVGAALASVGFAPVSALGLVILGLGALATAGRGALHMAGGAAIASYAMRLGASLGVLLPLGFAAGVFLGTTLTQQQWEAALSDLDAVTSEAQVLIGATSEQNLITPTDPEAPQGFADRLLAPIQGAAEGVGAAVDAVGAYGTAARVFVSQADQLFAASLTILGVFALRMIVLPALLLWGALALLRRSSGAG